MAVSGSEVAVAIVNGLLLVCGIGGFIIFLLVLLKLNKALDIWLKQI
jgi:hypothetical protein